MVTCDFRVGYGYDVHRFAKSRKLVLGGVEIPHKVGLTGHSDADVLLHSVCDALLGAAGFEDIGHQFPNTDSRFKDISSLILLKETYKLISKKKFKVGRKPLSLKILTAFKILSITLLRTSLFFPHRFYSVFCIDKSLL